MPSNIFFEARVAMVVNTVILSDFPVVTSKLRIKSTMLGITYVSYQGWAWARAAGQISRQNSAVIGHHGGLRLLSYQQSKQAALAM